MNRKKLKAAEQHFLDLYPGGFLHPAMQALGKKHKMEQMIEQAQQMFAKKQFTDARAITANMSKLVSRSSMVSLFEKPKFRDYVAALDSTGAKSLAKGLQDFLHGNQHKGFNAMVEVLAPAKLAKWSLLTVIPNYYAPDKEVFVKPTTAKGVIEYFELSGMSYNAKPTWEFYEWYRSEILAMKAKTHQSITTSNAAFCGFLMMSMAPGKWSV